MLRLFVTCSLLFVACISSMHVDDSSRTVLSATHSLQQRLLHRTRTYADEHTEMDTHTHTHTHTQTDAGHQHDIDIDNKMMVGYTTYKTDIEFKTPPLDMNTIRTHIAGASAAQVTTTAKGVIGNFVYETVSGTPIPNLVTRVYGKVQLRTTARANYHQVCYSMCDAAFYFSFNKHRVAREWNSGHVVASKLGGSDTEPLNFFPHHAYSNSRNGKWWRMEMIIGGIAKVMLDYGLKDSKANQCTGLLLIDFEYTKYKYMPSGGKYTYAIDETCLDKFLALGTGGWSTPLSTWTDAPDPIYGMGGPTVAPSGVKATDIDKFIKTSKAIEIDNVYDGLKGKTFTITWENDKDIADKIKDPELYWD